MNLFALNLVGDAAVVGAVGIQTGLWLLMHWRIRSLEEKFKNGVQSKIEDIKEDIGDIKVECARRSGAHSAEERSGRSKR